jgi:hypothetical protein
MDKTTKSLTPAELKLKHELLHFCEPDPPEIFRHIQPVQPPSEKVLKKVRSGVHCTPRTGLWWTENRECVRARANTLEMFTSRSLTFTTFYILRIFVSRMTGPEVKQNSQAGYFVWNPGWSAVQMRCLTIPVAAILRRNFHSMT